MPLSLTGHDVVHMGKNTFMWIQVTSFALEGDRSDRDELAELIASPGYAHDYASPFDPDAKAVEPALHGRWWLRSLRPESFTSFSAGDAQALLQSWADEQEWTEPGFRQPREVQERLQEIYALLRSGTLYRLANPGSADEHEYGCVTGAMGFHEFVVLDRAHVASTSSLPPTTRHGLRTSSDAARWRPREPHDLSLPGRTGRHRYEPARASEAARSSA